MEEELTRHSPGKDTLLTIGVFDGVHLGHKYLISQLVELAGTRDLLPGVVTFRQHPQEVLSSQTRIPFLTDLEERSRLLEKEGVALVVPLSFTREWAELGARRFVGLLMKHLRMRGLVIGADFALGRGREGDTETLCLLGSEMGFSADVVPAVKLGGEVVSSTGIRQALAGGDMAKVRRMAGRDFSLHGRVITGAGRGTGMGIPTANLDIDPEHAIPLDGVYATRAYIEGRSYHSMTNIGRKPTFGDSVRGVEVYIIDYSGDLYGRELSIDIVERLRGEERFSSVAELKKQIAEDVKKGKTILDAGGVNQV